MSDYLTIRTTGWLGCRRKRSSWRARAAWEAALDRVPRDRLAAPGAAGTWSAKDVQAHLTTNNRWMAGQLRALARGASPTAAECYGHERTPPPGTDLAD